MHILCRVAVIHLTLSSRLLLVWLWAGGACRASICLFALTWLIFCSIASSTLPEELPLKSANHNQEKEDALTAHAPFRGQGWEVRVRLRWVGSLKEWAWGGRKHKGMKNSNRLWFTKLDTYMKIHYKIMWTQHHIFLCYTEYSGYTHEWVCWYTHSPGWDWAGDWHTSALALCLAECQAADGSAYL